MIKYNAQKIKEMIDELAFITTWGADEPTCAEADDIIRELKRSFGETRCYNEGDDLTDDDINLVERAEVFLDGDDDYDDM